MILLTERRGKRVRLACGCRSIDVVAGNAVYTRWCEICHAVTEVEVRRSDIQPQAFIVIVRPVRTDPPVHGGAAGDVVPAPSPATQLSLTETTQQKAREHQP